MAIIDVPAKFGFSSVNKFCLQRATNVVRSIYTGKRQVLAYPFQMWVLDATLIEYDGADAGRVRSFLTKLRGQSNTFRLPVPGYKKPSTGYSGTPSVKTAAAAGLNQLALKNGVANSALFLEGDFFTINDECKIVSADATFNSLGEVIVYFEPQLRQPVAVDALVICQNPTILMAAKDDTAANWGIKPPFRHSVKFEAEEAF